MTQVTSSKPTYAELLNEARGYRTSLESLMAVGRALLLNPSMEDDSANAFKMLTEDTLEQADHQGDLTAVDGVEEPKAVVELIMQDVLTPRLTEIEEIERALEAKADSEEPVPFTTRDAMTAASMEAQYKVEMLDLMKVHARTVRTLASLEAAPIEVVRPEVLALANFVKPSLEALNISLEELGETQVLGEMADAVQRIEALVEKAHENATDELNAAQQEASDLGAQGNDPVGDLLETHRSENQPGVKLDEDVSVSSVANDTQAAPDTASEADVDMDGAINAEGEGDTEAVEVDADGVATDVEGDLDMVEDGADAGASTAEEVLEDASSETEEAADVAADVDAEVAENLTDESSEEAAEGEESQDDDNEEEEEDENLSLESLQEPVVLEKLSEVTENADKVRDNVASLLSSCDALNLLTEKGKDALLAGVGSDFVMTSDMFVPETADVLVRNYPVWQAAALRDGEPNIRSLIALVG